jgi:hypothetical protein
MNKSNSRGLLRRGVLFLMSALLGLTLVALPITFWSLGQDFLRAPEGQLFRLGPAAAPDPARSHTHLTLSVVAFDEGRQLATLRVAGYNVCRPTCTESQRVLFFALRENEREQEGLPPSAAIRVPAADVAVSETIQLPVQGRAMRYPFDHYELWLGVSLVLAPPDGPEQPLSAEESSNRLVVAVQDQLTQLRMRPPLPADPALVQPPDALYDYLYPSLLTFRRPFYLQVLAVLLLLFISACAFYTVTMVSLHDLVLGAGGVVLGTWGIRSILTPTALGYLSVVDVLLSFIILGLLAGITVRATYYVLRLDDLHLLRPGAAAPAVASDDRCDHPGCTNPIHSRCSACRQAYCPRHISGGAEPICDTCS